MSLSLEDVKKIAHLARLELTEAELAAYRGQLSAVLEYAEMLNELDLEGVPPTTTAVIMQNVMREDTAVSSLPLSDTLHNAAQHAQNQFLIQSVLDE